MIFVNQPMLKRPSGVIYAGMYIAANEDLTYRYYVKDIIDNLVLFDYKFENMLIENRTSIKEFFFQYSRFLRITKEQYENDFS